MKKFLSLLLCFSMIVGICVMAACNKQNQTTQSSTNQTETVQSQATTTVQTEVETTTVLPETTETTTVIETTEQTTETTKVEEPQKPEKTTLKILAVGNSYSQDTTAYVYNIAKDLGYEKVIVVNLYYPGCPLELHARYLKGRENRAYDYEYNDNGTWVKKGKVCLEDVIDTQDWDIITLQQKSGYSGDPTTYEPYLTTVVNYIKEKKPDAKLLWNMTWAYQANSTESTFSKYGKNQMTMYNAILDTVKSKVLVKSEFDGVIPVGTAVQNLRTSYIGDTLQRDSLHLSYDLGRYLAGLMWMKQISGLSIDQVTWTPSNYEFNDRELKAIKEAVNNAYDNPFEITQSTFKDDISFEELLASYDIDYDKYNEVDIEFTYYGFYNSTETFTPYTKAGGSNLSNLNQFACTQMFERKDLPNGTLILLLDGYQYRPEGWVKESRKNSSAARPTNVTQRIVLVDSNWWGDWNYRAFNVAKRGNPALTDEQMQNLSNVIKILVPKDLNADLPDISGTKGVDVKSIVEKAGYDYSKYTVLKYDVVFNAYYNSTANSNIVSKATGSTASNLSQFATTKDFFTKDDIPNGSLIIIIDGYQYRPEGWTSLSSKNSSSERPTNVTKQIVEVDDGWWGKWNYRAFNIAQKNNPNLSQAEMSKLDSVLFILVPNAE